MTTSGGRTDTGSATLQALAVLIFLAALGMGTAAFLGSAARSLGSAAAEADRARSQAEAVAAVIDSIASDPDNDADSFHDPAYALASAAGLSVSMEDESSKFDPNWLRKGFIDGSALAGFLLPGASAQALQQYRQDTGLSTSLASHYGRIFSAEALGTDLCARSYANINSSDEFALRSLYEAVTGDFAGAEAFHSRISQQLLDKKILTDEELPSFFGVSGKAMLSVCCAQGQINVNTARPFILLQVLSYRPYALRNPSGTLDAILAARAAGEIDARRMRELVGLPAEHPIYGYLGVHTWFWNAYLGSGRTRIRAVLARRLPAAPSATKPSITLVALEEAPQ